MQESIESKTEIVRDPAITAAIREIKSRIKEFAEYQKTGKKAFREAMSQWTKDSQKYNHTVPVWHDQPETATALLIIYGRLRQTKRSHFSTPEAFDKYYNAIGIGWRRQEALTAVHSWLKSNHPTAYAKLLEVA